MTKEIIIKFPNSKRRLTAAEEREVERCSNLINMTYADKNPFVTTEQKQIQSSGIIRACIKKIFELNEDKK